MRGYDENRIQSYIYAMKASEKVLEGESERIRRAFREYVLCHLNLILVRNVFNRSIKVSEKERWDMMRRILKEDVFRQALEETDLSQCLSPRMVPELFLKGKMLHAAGAACIAKAMLNDYREKKADQKANNN